MQHTATQSIGQMMHAESVARGTPGYLPYSERVAFMARVHAEVANPADDRPARIVRAAGVLVLVCLTLSAIFH